MPRDLFGDVCRPSISVGSRKWYTVPVSLISHAAVVLVVVLIPLLAPSVMPAVFADNDPSWIPTVLPKPPAPPPRPTTAPPTSNPHAAPTEAPHAITPEKPIEAGFENDQPSIGVINGIADSNAILAPPPPPVASAPPKPVPIGGTVRRPVQLTSVQPI